MAGKRSGIGGAVRALAALLVTVTATGGALAQVAPPRDARNASYWDRIDHPPAEPLHPPLDWFKPLVKVAGATAASASASASASAAAAAAAAGETTVPAQALEEASRFAAANNSQALIVVHKRVVQLERYYNGADANTGFSSHSFAKTLDALAIGAAIAEGRIASIDQPASQWLPEWRDGKRDAITLRQLLQMSGGFRTPPSANPASHYLQLHYGSDVEATVRNAPLAYAPGTEFAFDNDNVNALGVVVERATGVPYAEYVSSRIWKKVGAGDAAMLLDRDGGRAMSFCCMLSRPRDWIGIAQMLLDQGMGQGGQRVVPAAWIDAMRQPSPANPNFGLQLFLGSAWLDPRINRRVAEQKATLQPALDADLVYLSGAGGQVLMIVPSRQLIILRVGKGAPGWRDQTIPNLLHTALVQEQP